LAPPGGPRAVLAALRREAEAGPDREACGFVVRLRDGSLRVRPVRNAAPRGRDGFLMDARESLSVLRWTDRAGGRVVAVYHSHLEADAALSERDRAGALLAGRPALPGADQLVISLRGGRAVEARRYRWDGRDFRPVPVDSW
jgi:proteasome lid subunit RPN8/RPN11